MSVELAWAGTPADLEDSLALRCKSGDQAAFDEIVERYHVRLYRFAFRMLNDRSEAEDAVQETFIRTFKALPAYRPDGYFSSWIYRIALNECRRRMRAKRIFFPLELVEQAGNSPDPQNNAIVSERNRLLRQAVSAMPEHYRIVLTLFYFEDLSVEQISKTIGISVSAVKVRLHRGREKLSHKVEVEQ